MDKNKRRSSLRKIDETGDTACRLKRRISFSGKKAIREFSKEEEAKTWNHSYEVSDHANGEDGSLFANKCAKNAIANPTQNSTETIIPVANKLKTGKCTNINTTQTLRTNDHLLVLNNDNSIDITLFEQEGVKNVHPNTLSLCSTYPELSFSLIDHEKEALTKTRKSVMAFERTCDFIHDLSTVGKIMKTGSIVSNTMDQKKVRRTVLLDESIDACTEIFSEKKMSHNVGINKEKHKFSVCNVTNMDMSVEAEVNKENIEPPNKTSVNNGKQSYVENISKLKEFSDKYEFISDFEKKLDNISFQMDLDDEYEQNNDCQPISEISPKKTNKTILFNADINSDEQNVNETLCLNSENVAVNNSMDITLVEESEAVIGKDNAKSKEEKLEPKVIVLKKFNTTKKSLSEVPLNPFAMVVDKEDSKLNTLVPNSQDKNDLCETTYQSSMCYSPETSSPLFPPELVSYSNKKLNFRQINDDIEHGIIQVFRDAQCTPLVSLKKNRLNVHEADHNNLQNVRRTIFFDENILPVDENVLVSEPKNTNDEEINFRKKHTLRFSQAGELLLNNTNFLTHAKLGDETASCNTSKNSNLSRRETLYFNMEIPCEDNENITDKRCIENLDESHNNRFSEVHTSSKNDIHDQPSASAISSQRNLYFPKAFNEKVTSSQMHTEHHGMQHHDMQNHDDSMLDSNMEEDGKKHIFTCLDKKNKISKTEVNGFKQMKESEINSYVTNNNNSNNVSNASILSFILDDKLEVKMVDKNKMGSKKKSPACDIKNDGDLSIQETCNNGHKQDVDIGSIRRSLMVSKRSLIPRPTALFNDTIQVDDINVTPNVKRTDDKDFMDIQTAGPNSPLARNKLVSNSTNDSSPVNNEKFKQSILLHSEPFTPRRYIKSRLADGTPHRSLIEFEDLERACNQTILPDAKHITPLRPPRRVTNIIPHKMECERSDGQPNSEFPSSRNNALRRFTNVVPYNIDLEETVNTASNNDVNNLQSFSEPLHVSQNTIRDLKDNKELNRSIEKCVQQIDCESTKLYKNHTIIENTTIIEDDDSGEDNAATEKINENSIKRLPYNLTPLISTSKKRQTIVYSDCGVEEEKQVNITSRMSPMMTRKTQLFSEEMQIEADEGLNVLPVVEVFDNTADECNTTKGPDRDAMVEELQQQLKSKINLDEYPEEEHSQRCVSICIEEEHNSSSNTPSPKKNNSLKNLSNIDCDLETIQIPRRATTHSERKSSCLNMLSTIDAIGKMHYTEMDQFKDSMADKDAITISDVSVFYQAHQSKLMSLHNDIKKSSEGQASPNATSRASDTELQNVALFKKKYINCTSDSLFLTLGAVDCEDIEKTRISLVETLSDDNDDDELEECNNLQLNCKESAQNILIDDSYVAKEKTLANTKQNMSIKKKDVCRKCNRCQDTILNETSCSEIEPFALPTLPKFPNLGLDRLRRLRQLPSLKDTHDYWRRLSAEQTFHTDHVTITDASFNANDETLRKVKNENNSAESIIANYKMDVINSIKAITIRAEEENQPRATFVLRLLRLLKSENMHNWIFDYQMQIKNIFIFTHKKIVTTNFIMPFEPLDVLGENVLAKSITMSQTRLDKKHWSVLHYIIDFQLKLNFSLILLTLGQINSETGVCELLKRVGNLCEETHSLAFRLFRLVCREHATLTRDGNTICVRKVVPKSSSGFNKIVSLEKHEFLIEIKNINKICFRDIRKPQLYSFKEEIELLPCGLDFIRLFLRNPLKFLK